MFASFKTLFKKINKNVKKSEADSSFVKITRQEVENMLTKLDEAEERSVSGDARSVSSDNAVDALDSLSIADIRQDDVNGAGSLHCFNDTKSEVSSVLGDKQEPAEVVDCDLQKTINKINSLQCPFTWNLKSNNRKLISFVQNKFGEYNLDISSVEFSFERYLCNVDHKVEAIYLRFLFVNKFIWLNKKIIRCLGT